MNEVDKTTDLSYDLTFQLLLTTWLLLAFNTCMYFSRHCYTCSSLSSLAQLDSGCVCACSCAGMCIYACQSLKFEAGTMVVMVPRQYFQLMNCEGSAVHRSPRNIIFASCQSIGRVSWFLVGLAVVPQLWQENLPCFCRVQRLFNEVLTAYIL